MICPNCGQQNPPDSKFCNNCGARLTSGEKTGAGAPESFPQPHGADEPDALDWGEDVPDWLKPDDAEGDEQVISHVGEDLPTWLLDEGTGPALFEDERPTGGRESRIDSGEEDEAGPGDQDKQGLPEWLRGLAPKGTGPLPSSRAGQADETPTPSLDDWLAGLDESEEAPPAPSWLSGVEAEDEDATGPVDSWPDEPQGGFESADDWLSDLDVGDDVPPLPETPEEPWAGLEQSGFSVDEWLAELEPAEQQPEPGAPESSEAEEAEEETGVPDWLAADVEAGASTKEPQLDALEAIPDWLADLEGEGGREEIAGHGEITGEDEGLVGAAGGAGDDWLSSLEDDWREEGVEADEELPAWLKEAGLPSEPGTSGTDAGVESPPAGPEEPEEAPAEAPALDWWPAGEEAPDWLMVTEEPEEAGETAQTGDEDADWLRELDAAIGQLEAASQDVLPGVPGEAAEQELASEEDDLETRDTAEEGPGEGEAEPEAGGAAGAVPDWLAELEATSPDAGDMAEVELSGWLQEATPDESSPEEAVPAEPKEPEHTFAAIPAEGSEEEDLPDWLVEVTASELAASDEVEGEAGRWPFDGETTGEGPEVTEILGGESDDEIVGADELPDWLGDVVGAEAEELPAYLEDEEAVPDVLAGQRLPGWLEDSLPDEERAEPTPLEELPPWLVPPVGAGAGQPETTPEMVESGEWADVLGELAESQEIGAELSAAEIPEWLEALRPQEELQDRKLPADAEPVTEGPLAGLRGAVTVMPVVAAPRSAEYTGEPEVSQEQQEQAELLRQLVRQEPQEAMRVVARERARPSPWLRVLLTVLLFAAVLAGLFLPDLVAVETTPVMPIAPAAEVLQAGSGRPVLVVFDYTPAFAGILNDQASVLLQTLAAQGSPVVYASQSAAGLGLGTTAVEGVEGLQTQRLGYIAGETVGLRRIARCLGAESPGAAACESYPPGTGEAAAILLLTAERDSLIDWIEQVEAVSETPLVAGVTEALAPVAAPYYATGQLDGVLAGQAATAALAEASGIEDVSLSPQPLALAAWLAAALLLVGNIVYFFIGLVGARRTRKA